MCARLSQPNRAYQIATDRATIEKVSKEGVRGAGTHNEGEGGPLSTSILRSSLVLSSNVCSEIKSPREARAFSGWDCWPQGWPPNRMLLSFLFSTHLILYYLCAREISGPPSPSAALSLLQKVLRKCSICWTQSRRFQGRFGHFI